MSLSEGVRTLPNMQIQFIRHLRSWMKCFHNSPSGVIVASDVTLLCLELWSVEARD